MGIIYFQKVGLNRIEPAATAAISLALRNRLVWTLEKESEGEGNTRAGDRDGDGDGDGDGDTYAIDWAD